MKTFFSCKIILSWKIILTIYLLTSCNGGFSLHNEMKREDKESEIKKILISNGESYKECDLETSEKEEKNSIRRILAEDIKYKHSIEKNEEKDNKIENIIANEEHLDPIHLLIVKAICSMEVGTLSTHSARVLEYTDRSIEFKNKIEGLLASNNYNEALKLFDSRVDVYGLSVDDAIMKLSILEKMGRFHDAIEYGHDLLKIYRNDTKHIYTTLCPIYILTFNFGKMKNASDNCVEINRINEEKRKQLIVEGQIKESMDNPGNNNEKLVKFRPLIACLAYSCFCCQYLCCCCCCWDRCILCKCPYTEDID